MKVYAVITRACLYDCQSYQPGDELTSHDVADKLIAFGVAARPEDVVDAPESAEPPSDVPAEPAQSTPPTEPSTLAPADVPGPPAEASTVPPNEVPGPPEVPTAAPAAAPTGRKAKPEGA